MTGAGRLSSGPQPVTANAAPLCLSCTVDRGPHGVGEYLCSAAPSPSGMEARRVKNPGAKPGFHAPAIQPGPKGDGPQLAKRVL